MHTYIISCREVVSKLIYIPYAITGPVTMPNWAPISGPITTRIRDFVSVWNVAFIYNKSEYPGRCCHYQDTAETCICRPK